MRTHCYFNQCYGQFEQLQTFRLILLQQIFKELEGIDPSKLASKIVIEAIFIYIFPLKGGDPAADSSTATLLRLHPSYRPYLRHLPPRRVSPTTSSIINSHGVTGGVYKAREHIHRGMLIRDY